MVSPAQLLTLYLLGITVSFSPCYLPVFPILIAVASKNSTGKGAIAVLLFSAGATLSVALYGVAAAMSATFLSTIAENMLVHLPVMAGYLLIGLGLAEFTPIREVFEALPTISARFKGVGLAHSFLAGLLFSLAAAPCSLTPLIAFLMTVGAEELRGGSAFLPILSFSLGIGLTLMAVGITSVITGRKVMGALAKVGLIKFQARLAGTLLIVLGVLTIVTGENFEVIALSGAQTYIAFAEIAGVAAGCLVGVSLLRAGTYLGSRVLLTLAVGLLLVSAHRTVSLLSQVGVYVPGIVTDALLLASRLALSSSLAGFLVLLGRNYSGLVLVEPTLISQVSAETFTALLDAALAISWFGIWVKRDKLLAFSSLFFAAPVLSNPVLYQYIPDPVKPLAAAVILPMQLSMLPVWRKINSTLSILELFDEPQEIAHSGIPEI